MTETLDCQRARITFANYDVAADGQRFLMIRNETSSGRLNVVLNWAEELKRLVSRAECVLLSKRSFGCEKETCGCALIELRTPAALPTR